MGDPHWAATAIAVAIAVDLLSGDPPGRWHPVAWMGSLLGWGRRRLARGSSGTLLVRGALLIAACASLAALAGSTIASVTAGGGWIGVIVEGLALKLSLSLRDLASACLQVSRALEDGNLAEARRLVGNHLVSRPTSGLDQSQVASGAVESAGKNLTDVFLDLEYFGKTAARLNDVFNPIPARTSAVSIAAVAGLAGGDARAAWRVILRDRGKDGQSQRRLDDGGHG